MTINYTYFGDGVSITDMEVPLVELLNLCLLFSY